MSTPEQLFKAVTDSVVAFWAACNAVLVVWERVTQALNRVVKLTQVESSAAMANKAQVVNAGLAQEHADALEQAFPQVNWGNLLLLLQKYGPQAAQILIDILAALGAVKPPPPTP
jgi:hypothetical protein